MEEKIFILDSVESYKLSEKFQNYLYNKYNKVTITNYGLNGVRIKGSY